MSPLTQLQIPCSSQRIPWRRRADLKIVPLEFSGQRSWGVKDPVTLSYFELRDEEYFVLQNLDGRSTFGELCQAFFRQYRPQTLAVEELQQFTAQLAAQGLVVAGGVGYGRSLVARDLQNRARRRWMQLSNLLCIRFRGFDPDRLLAWLQKRLGWLFSPLALAAGVLLIVAAVVLVVTQFDRLQERLPEARALLGPRNLVWIPLLLAAVKLLHEFGHGLTCKRFGGECRELGAMLLVFTPTLYCNVSDMWMVRDKWKRMAVSAAGMWVEAIIAAACTLLWWYSAPGLFHSLCLNLMFICGISTFLINGNPLLRYDGYFVMADWLEIPNLQQQSRDVLRQWLGWWFCGLSDHGESRSFSRQALLMTYGLASLTYRIVLICAIIWALYHWLQPYGLSVIAEVIAVPTVGLMVLSPMWSGVRFLRSEQNRKRVNWPRFRYRVLAAAATLGLLATVPVPSRVKAVALLDDDTAQRVYATLGGTLTSGAKLGEQVKAGQIVAQLVDPRIQKELIRLEGEFEQHRVRFEQLQRRRILEPQAAALIPPAREAMRDFQAQLQQLRDSADRLVLRAPCDGIVLPAEPQAGSSPPGTLPTWNGSPLEERNRGCHVVPGTTVCLIGPRESRVAILLVTQDDINLVRTGQVVRTVWRELAGQVLTGQVIEIAGTDLDRLPRAAVQRLKLPVRTTADGDVMPVGTWYQVRVRLDDTRAPLLRRAAGDARILVDPQSLATRICRWLSRTFGV